MNKVSELQLDRRRRQWRTDGRRWRRRLIRAFRKRLSAGYLSLPPFFLPSLPPSLPPVLACDSCRAVQGVHVCTHPTHKVVPRAAAAAAPTVLARKVGGGSLSSPPVPPFFLRHCRLRRCARACEPSFFRPGRCLFLAVLDRHTAAAAVGARSLQSRCVVPPLKVICNGIGTPLPAPADSPSDVGLLYLVLLFKFKPQFAKWKKLT